MANHKESLRSFERQGVAKAVSKATGRPLIVATLAEACVAVGVLYRDPSLGRWTYADLEGDPRGRGDGRIKVFPDGRGGVVINMKTGVVAYWFDDYGRHLTPEETAERRQQIVIAQREAEQEERRRLERGIALSGAILKAARPVDAHPYLTRKHVKPDAGYGVLEADEVSTIMSGFDGNQASRLFSPKTRTPMTGSILVIPLWKHNGTAFIPQSIEFIDADGAKTFLRGASTKGAYWLPLDLKHRIEHHQTLPKRLGIAEGVATAQSVMQVCGFPVAAAMSCGGLTATALALRSLCPRSDLIVLGDIGNGAEHAERAARLSGGRSYFPEFDEFLRARFQDLTGGSNPTDFNDFFIAKEAI